MDAQAHHQASDIEIRERIEQVEDLQTRMLFKYQYECLGRISEVAGKYMPHVDDHEIIEVNGEEFVMWIVKTAKRKGRLRPCARPLNKEYDPWAKEIYDYIQTYDDYPFTLHENKETSKTYAMNAASKMFDGLYWPMIDYTKTDTREYSEDMVKSKRFNDKGYEEKLVVFPDGMRSWTSDPDVITFSVKVDQRWRGATSHVIRKRSVMTLMNDYLFDGVDAGYIGGWTLSSQHDGTPQALKHYMFMDLRDSRESIPQLTRQAKRYARKLLVPYETFI
jgi:hypothetical protein